MHRRWGFEHLRVGATDRARCVRDEEDAEIDAELGFHLDQETDRLMDQLGIDGSEARRRAERAFGVLEEHKQTIREVRALRWRDDLEREATVSAGCEAPVACGARRRETKAATAPAGT